MGSAIAHWTIRNAKSSALHLLAVSMPVRSANVQIGRAKGLGKGKGTDPEVQGVDVSTGNGRALRSACMQ